MVTSAPASEAFDWKINVKQSSFGLATAFLAPPHIRREENGAGGLAPRPLRERSNLVRDHVRR
jgi:hypothetical protein